MERLRQLSRGHRFRGRVGVAPECVKDALPDLARLLIEAHADIRATSVKGFTPLLLAARNGDIDMAKILLAAGVKVSLGSTSKRLSTGRADVGVGFAVTGDLGKWCVNFNGGEVFPGDIEFFPGLDTAPMAGLAGSVGYRMRRTSLWLQLQWEQSPLRLATKTALSDNVYDVSLGMRFPVARGVRGYVALTENVLAFENSSDIGFHGGVTWSSGGK